MKKMTNYTKLSDKLPLTTPWTIMIEPTNVCNFKCTFCPTGDKELLKKVNRPIGHMSLKLFKKIVDDIVMFNQKVKSLRLFKDGESFLNRDLIDMIKYAKEKNIAEEVYIISNGSLIDEELAKRIVESGLDKIRISIEHVTNEKYKEITQTYGKYDQIVKNIRFLYEYKMKSKSNLMIDIKIISSLLKKNELQKLHQDFKNISDIITEESLMGWSNSLEKDFTLGMDTNVGISGSTKLRNINVCPEPFKGLSINFNGDVSVCCVDWSHKTIVGNANYNTIKEIWTGEELRKFRLTHLLGNRKEIEACANCHYLQGVNELSNLDSVANKLMKEL